MEINSIDFAATTPNSVFLLVGRRRSGKSTNMFSLMRKFANVWKWGVVICPSQSTLADYYKYVPKQFCHEDIDLNLIQRVIDHQNNAVKSGTAQNIFMILDDCAFDSKKFRSKELKYLFFNSRHLKVTLLISIQDALVLTPALRSNVDYVLACREKAVSYRQRLYDAYSICFEDFKQFDVVFRALTENHGTMVMAAAAPTQSDKVKDNIFHFKSDFPCPDFKVAPTEKWWGVLRTKVKPKVKIIPPNQYTESKGTTKKVGKHTSSQEPLFTTKLDTIVPEKKAVVNFSRKYRSRFS